MPKITLCITINPLTNEKIVFSFVSYIGDFSSDRFLRRSITTITYSFSRYLYYIIQIHIGILIYRKRVLLWMSYKKFDRLKNTSTGMKSQQINVLTK